MSAASECRAVRGRSPPAPQGRLVQAASRGARTRQLRRELLRHSRRVVHRRGAARPAVIHGSCRPASTTSTPLAEGHRSNRCRRPFPGWVATCGGCALLAFRARRGDHGCSHERTMGDLHLGRGEWPRGHEPMRCYPRASLSVARGSACRGMLTSVTVQPPRAPGIALEKSATLASPGWTDGGVVETAHHQVPVRGCPAGHREAGLGLAEVLCLVPEARGATVAARDPSPGERRGHSCPIPSVRPPPAALMLCCLQDSIAWLAPGASSAPWRARGHVARCPR